MKIPEQLKGKEVKKFIDLRFNGEDKLYVYLIDFIEFYAQPFKPEEVSNLFEGWTFENEDELYNDKYGIIIYTNCITIIKLKSYTGLYKFLYNLPVPKTQSDFITSCLQVGIKLYWKK